MDQEAQKRKERLAALRKRKLGDESNRSTSDAEKTLKFRSYTPHDEQLLQHVEIATPDTIGNTVEEETKHLTKETLAQAQEKQKEEVDLFNLAPKKPNWDLKRDVEKKLEKLDRRTQRAIYEIIRIRLEGDKHANLADIVANAEAQQQFEAQHADL
ncbi:mRNA splicing factor [Gilbertella persicaria]|uniref:mRNA splicing factor n=1 Tax=Gilbertella persicaria TaxID=101096 RepID=UPI00221F555C|nr:mRNA splicing factor [Gilbertella persicaria]KAI8051056.1 mRNA splicing factor [Gilbertella persicaria]